MLEKNSLDKETLDKVREIDGFPIGNDEDVITLSIHPDYTACPNPWLEDFVKENGYSYDANNDDYQKRPFAHDVSEGKGDSIYYAHSYHTKIPHKAIIPYLMHFTEPGDLIYDGFCGTGMTGIASQMCEFQNNNLTDDMGKKYADSKWGKRSTILCDLSPYATFIAYNYNNSSDSKAAIRAFIDEINKRLYGLDEEKIEFVEY